jgi:class 3 adenylate cyclase
MMPEATAEQMRWFNDLARVSTSPENAIRLMTEMSQIDVVDLLPQVTAPTLVLHAQHDAGVPFEWGRELAASIPGARFVSLESRNHFLLECDPAWKTFLTEVRRFLDIGERAETKSTTTEPSLLTLLFTDIASSTSLTQRLGDAKAQELVRAHDVIVRDALKAHGGSEIKHTGDGIMASFRSASRALECSVAIQQAVAGHREEYPDASLEVHIGLNAGEPIAEDEDLFGTAVQLAARVCAHAEPGQVLASNVVQELAAGKGFLFSDQGDVVLRGFEDPVRLYEVRGG